MKRSTVNFLLDLCAALVVLGLVATGGIMRFVLPPGSGRSKLLWGLGRHDWGTAHFWLAVGFVVMAVAHVAMHWAWVLSMFRSTPGDGQCLPRRRTRIIIGLVTLVLLVGLVLGFTLYATARVQGLESPGYRGSQTGAGHREHSTEDGSGGARIRGSMTLEEAAAECGLSAEEAKRRLGLPATVSSQDKLGPIRQQYGLTMSEIRLRLDNAPD